ncbi:Hypothetical predicted protein [Cloeon dipterum]|uniref:Uncharacterized protein n=1 Tax=Cloeon dipterum TaxID=197152 RepID=A0A8S1E5A0_9INSE|nr:Hypothetical predicted protein [Cloeon dipterum]
MQQPSNLGASEASAEFATKIQLVLDPAKLNQQQEYEMALLNENIDDDDTYFNCCGFLIDVVDLIVCVFVLMFIIMFMTI